MTGPLAGILRALGGHDALRPAEDPLTRALFADAQLGVMILDRRGRIARANAAMDRLIRDPARLATGAPAAGVFEPASSETIGREFAMALRGRRAARPLAGRLADAAPREGGTSHGTRVEVDMAPIRGRPPIAAARDEPGPVIGLVVWLTDISARSHMEEQLAQVHRLQSLGQFAGGIAHDFNNLLTAVLGAADLALGDPALGPAIERELRQIRQSAERGAALVRQLVAFGRQQRLRPRVMAVNAALESLSDLLRRLLGGTITLALELEEPGLLVRVDPTQFDQVMINLCVNARDAMPGGGTLTIRSGRTTLYRARTAGRETTPPGRYVTVEVEDTGIGIPAETLPRIFDPFFTTRRDRGGTGLGLSTVHGIVRQSGGFLSVDSVVGRGTRMCLYLQRARAGEGTAEGAAEEAPPREPHAAAPRAPVCGRVLLVDDEPGVRLVTERALRRRGWEVLPAASAEDALARAAELYAAGGTLHAAVSDVMMPGMDGPALVRRLRAIDPGLRAILISGYAEEAVRASLGAADVAFLEKPFAFAALLDLLNDSPARRDPEPSLFA